MVRTRHNLIFYIQNRIFSNPFACHSYSFYTVDELNSMNSKSRGNSRNFCWEATDEIIKVKYSRHSFHKSNELIIIFFVMSLPHRWKMLKIFEARSFRGLIRGFCLFIFSDWAEEAVAKAEILRLIYQGRFLHSNVTLGALGLPFGKTTVMHLVPRENLPEPNSQGKSSTSHPPVYPVQEKNERRSSGQGKESLYLLNQYRATV